MQGTRTNAFEVALLFAIPGFILLMLVEFAYSRLSGSGSWSNQADAISRISSGLTYLALRTLELGVLVISYELLFTWLTPQPLLDIGAPLYVLVFVWKDFTGYWVHRWAHAINPRYIDRNFGQIFCWDRLFGTFQEELYSDPPVYGITTPVRSYNPVQIELNYIGRLLRDAWHSRGWNRLWVFFSRRLATRIREAALARSEARLPKAQ